MSRPEASERAKRCAKWAVVSLVLVSLAVAGLLGWSIAVLMQAPLPSGSAWVVLPAVLAVCLLGGLWGARNAWIGWREVKTTPRGFGARRWRDRPRFPGKLALFAGGLAAVVGLTVTAWAGWSMIRAPIVMRQAQAGVTYADMHDAYTRLITYAELPEPYRSRKEEADRRQREYDEAREARQRGDDLTEEQRRVLRIPPLGTSGMLGVSETRQQRLSTGEVIEGYVFFELVPDADRVRAITGGLVDRWGQPIRFDRVDSDTFDLRSAGPDTVFDTDDDLVVSSDPQRDRDPAHW